MNHQRARASVIRAAVRAWAAGKPYVASEILATSGYGEYWPEFQRIALRRARGQYTAAIARASRSRTRGTDRRRQPA